MCLLKTTAFDVFNSGFSGSIFVLTTVVLRLWIFRPKLNVSFDGNSEDLQRFVMNANGDLLQLWVRLRVENRGILKLTHPKILCAKVTPIVSGKRFEKSITPFELPWSEVANSGELSVLFPGKFEHRFDLAWLSWGKSGAINQSPPKSFFLSRRDGALRNDLALGVKYELLILIANDNFLIPSHYVRLVIQLDVIDATKIPGPDGISVLVNILKQGNWWHWGWSRI